MAKSPHTAPFPIDVKKGEKYFWCTCGLSADQPFCDGSHKGSGMKSMLYEVKEDRTIWFCGCKETKNPPFCDDTHVMLRKIKTA